MHSTKEWEVNIFFKDLGSDEYNNNHWEDTLTISPSVYVSYDDHGEHIYTNRSIACTFAETRYIISQRPSDEYGDDWFETLSDFLDVAPPRIAALLKALPEAIDVNEDNVKYLVS
jgi:hypothetical protein